MHSPRVEAIDAEAIKVLEQQVINKYGLGVGNRKQRRAARSALYKDAKRVQKTLIRNRNERHLVLETLASPASE